MNYRFASLLISLLPTMAFAAPPIDIDIESLVYESKPVSHLQRGNLWAIKPLSGDKFLVRIPILLKTPDAEFEIDSNTLKFSGGRFVAVEFPAAPRDAFFKDRDGQELQFTEAVGKLRLQTEPPRFSREIILQPDGQVRRKLTRAFPGAEIHNGASAYAYVIDRKRLIKPDRNQPDYRDAIQDFVEANKFINRLNTDFVDPMPKRIWLIYELRQDFKAFSFDGDEPLKWDLDVELYDRIKSAVSTNSTAEEILDILNQLLGSSHLYHRRTGAAILADNTKHALVAGSPLLELTRKLCADPDKITRGLALTAVEKSLPAVEAAIALLSERLTDPDPGLSLRAAKSLQVRLNTIAALWKRENKDITPLLTAIAKSIGQVLTTAPTDETVTTDALDALFSLPKALVGSESLIADNAQLGNIHESRRSDLVQAVLQRAGKTPEYLAQQLLAVQLFGPADAPLTALTLDALEKLPKAMPKLPIQRPDHGLLALLSDAPEPMRKRAWAELDRFRIMLPEAPNDTAARQRVFDAFVSRTVQLSPTPIESIDFLISHGTGSPVPYALGLMASRGNGDKTRQAALDAILTAGNGPGLLGEVISTLPGDDRLRIARFWYESDPNLPEGYAVRPSPSAGILLHLEVADPDRAKERLADPSTWFAQQIHRQHRPTPYDWQETLGKQPLDYAMGWAHEDRRYAEACASVGLSWATWPSADLNKALIDLVVEHRKTLKEPVELRTKALQEWKRLVIENKEKTLQSVSANYRIQVRLMTPAVKGKPAEAPRNYDLGTHWLVNKTDAFEFQNFPLSGSIEQDPVRLRLASIRQLTKAPIRRGEKLPKVDWPELPFDLMPDRDQSWSGYLRLPDQAVVWVYFIREAGASGQ